MAYSADSFVADEQPTTAKWNKLWSNDASFHDGTGIDDDTILSRHIDWANTGAGDSGGVWWEELGRTTLGVAGDTISVSIAVRKYLQIRISMINTGGAVRIRLGFNGDTGSNYAENTFEAGTNSSATSQSAITIKSNGDSPAFAIADVENISTKEKLVISNVTSRGTAGAAAAPSYKLLAGKWSNTSDSITQIDVTNNSTGDFNATSEVVVKGHN